MVKRQIKHGADVWFFAVIIVIIFFDQLTKFLVKRTFVPQQGVEIIPNVLSFTYIPNTGIGFGLLQGFNTFMIVVVAAIIILMAYYYHKMHRTDEIPRTYFAFILAGAISNLIDRVFHGFVIDFIDLRYWPAFNLADSAITVGIVAWIIFHLRTTEKHIA